jgi:putative NADH-flavin reductase
MLLILYEISKRAYPEAPRPDRRKRQQMKLTIFAATGGIGRQLLGQAVAAGHDVTAVVRNPGKLSSPGDEVTGPGGHRGVPGGSPGLAGPRQVRAVQADLATADAEALAHAVGGADAVLSGLGPRSKAEYGIVTRGTRAIAGAMQATGVRRIVVVSAAPAGTVASPGRPDPPRHDPGDGFVMRHLLSPMVTAAFGKLYADLAQMEEELAGSDLDWTVVRPPRLTGKPLTGSYRTAYGQNVRRGMSISRADVAHLMLAVLGEPATAGQVVSVAY